MALITCADCGNQLSKSAVACPHCGRPLRKTSKALGGCALVIGATLLAMAAIGIGNSGKNANDAAPAKPQLSDAECRQDLQCYTAKHKIDATVACKPAIEKRAKYQAEWTDGFLTPAFSRIAWVDQKAGQVAYIGDKIKFQNGFGAWTFMTYRCAFDPATKRILDIDMSEGKLD